MNSFVDIIQKIKEVAKQQGITQTHLCKEIGKRPTFLNEVRLGKDRIDDSEISAIANILHTTPEYLRGETDDPSALESDWVAEIKKDPRKEGLMKRLAKMDDETRLKIEKIIDMLEGE